MPSRLTSATDQLRDMARRTPDDRERTVDLVRALSILSVVVGHWLLIAITETNGVYDGGNALRDLDWAHPVTWLFQVMPLFFLVGGYSNAVSLQAHERAGGDAGAWLLGRLDRILRPTAALLGALVGCALVARTATVDAELVAVATWLATLPLWFLAAYLAVVALAPAAVAAQRRYGMAVPVVLACLVGLGDLTRLGLGWGWVGDANHLLAWAAVHQIGVAWRMQQVAPRPVVGLPIAAVGLVALVLLTTVGPYPVSMVGVPGEDIDNTAPPTVALLALATTQIGLVLALRDPAERWLRRQRVWMAVVAVNAVILTVFLWHMAAAILAAVGTYGTGVFDSDEPVGSTTWLVMRLPWLLICALVLAVLVAVLAPVERSVPSTPKDARLGLGVPAALVAVAVPAVIVSLLGIALAGRSVDGPVGLPTWTVALFAVAATILLVSARRVRRSGSRNGDDTDGNDTDSNDTEESETDGGAVERSAACERDQRP